MKRRINANMVIEGIRYEVSTGKKEFKLSQYRIEFRNAIKEELSKYHDIIVK